MIPMQEYHETRLEKDLKELRERPALKTSITGLNNVLGGGLYAGLTIIAAVPSAGKTTLCIQIADDIARNESAAEGLPVLYYSLETSAAEMLARSCSREAAIIANLPAAENELQAEINNCFSAADFIYKAGGKNRIEAEMRYKSIEANLFFEDRAKPIFGSSNSVEADIIEINKSKGKRPAVIIDYLQLFSDRLDNGQKDERTALKLICSDLEKLAKQYHIQILCISSMNRDSYDKGKEFSSLHGSNSLEYSADVILTLDFSARGEGFNFDDEAAKPCRKMKIRTLKNRYAVQRGEAELDYLPRVNLFRDSPTISSTKKPF